MTDGVRVPVVWVVASHRLLTGPSGHRQLYTVVDEAGQRTLLNMGVQPVCFLRVPPVKQYVPMAMATERIYFGQSAKAMPRLNPEPIVEPGPEIAAAAAATWTA